MLGLRGETIKFIMFFALHTLNSHIQYISSPTVGRLGTAVSSAAVLAVASAAVDASGGKLTGQVFADGATPPRRVFPYEQ